MRALFASKFKGVTQRMIESNLTMIKDTQNFYKDYLLHQILMGELPTDRYVSLAEMYEYLDISPFVPVAKAAVYTKYASGIVVGAGSGEDCIDLLGIADWHLYDFTDPRMTNKAVGYVDHNVNVSLLKCGRDGDTIAPVKDEYVGSVTQLSIITIDSLKLDRCSLIAIDAEGAGLDILSGAVSTIFKLRPDIMIGIYHNWQEFLLVIPMLYDMGYTIEIIKTSTPMPQQPQLELTLLCRSRV